jgi:hypothetical protein
MQSLICLPSAWTHPTSEMISAKCQLELQAMKVLFYCTSWRKPPWLGGTVASLRLNIKHRICILCTKLIITMVQPEHPQDFIKQFLFWRFSFIIFIFQCLGGCSTTVNSDSCDGEPHHWKKRNKNFCFYFYFYFLKLILFFSMFRWLQHYRWFRR